MSNRHASVGVMLNDETTGLRPAIRAVLTHIVNNHRPAPDLPKCEFSPDAVDVAMRHAEDLIAEMIDNLSYTLERCETFCPTRKTPDLPAHSQASHYS